jgi:hypothetical protein
VKIRSAIRLLPLAAVIIVLGLAFAPVSFAGEDGDSPGPTQVGEVQGATATQSPAGHQGPTSSSSRSTSSSTSSSKHGVLGVQTALHTKTTGIQAGAGGLATSSAGTTLAIVLAGGGILLLAAAGSGLVPLRRRSDG